MRISVSANENWPSLELLNNGSSLLTNWGKNFILMFTNFHTPNININQDQNDSFVPCR